MTDLSSQIVYVLTNPAMPGIVKIGKTTQLEVEGRMKQLYGTGVPVPFDCAFACQVKDATEVERALHIAFLDNRINPNREFFKIKPEQAIAVLKLLRVDDITIEIEKTIESDIPLEDKQSAQDLKDARRPRMNFHQIGIPTDSVLKFKDGKTEVTVVSDTKIQLSGETYSLTAVTRRILGLEYDVQPSPYWTFSGKSLKEIYDSYHDSLEDS